MRGIPLLPRCGELAPNQAESSGVSLKRNTGEDGFLRRGRPRQSHASVRSSRAPLKAAKRAFEDWGGLLVSNRLNVSRQPGWLLTEHVVRMFSAAPQRPADGN